MVNDNELYCNITVNLLLILYSQIILHQSINSVYYTQLRAGRIDPAVPILARPVFLKVKTKFHFSKRQVINKVLV